MFKEIFKKLTLVFGIVLLLGGYFMSAPDVQAQAGAVTLYPGQTGNFTVTYENRGEVGEVDNALLSIYIGNKLTVDPSSIRERYGNSSQPLNCVTPSALVTSGAAIGTWGSAIIYRPRSATTTSAPCNGQTTAGPATLNPSLETPSLPANVGVITFSARLNADVTDPVGTDLRPIFNQGIRSIPQIGETNISSELSVIVAAVPACPTGQSLVNNQCAPIQCPAGQSLQGSACVDITCGAGQRLEGNNCVAIVCPTGQRLAGSNCVAIACPTGQALQGNSCIQLARTGGVAIASVLAGIAMIAAGGVFYVTRSKKLKLK